MVVPNDLLLHQGTHASEEEEKGYYYETGITACMAHAPKVQDCRKEVRVVHSHLGLVLVKLLLELGSGLVIALATGAARG